ncbi:hypothetical protein PBCV1_a558aL [Paramecium bursaria Chlorella virus 1]|uniref:Uncharacterized protein n=1 Tax=Paramecium bursaria Chlorella virus 1 TaxID=10506 RepID=F8TU59_PBCV1|nr:hypothetical protein PBCV1_a558aL [Paramecium bursaria Chlorella virus 1]AEI70120.1 hypothetical protein [Paramecium bursaria Chlorella virus 1]
MYFFLSFYLHVETEHFLFQQMINVFISIIIYLSSPYILPSFLSTPS